MAADGERIATNIRKGVLEYCVLALLSRGEMYGLQLADELVERGLTASEGSLYPLLARMRDAGSVTTRWESADSGRARRYYEITDTGREQLALFAEVWRGMAPQVGALLKEEP
ncbi:PadR family transcriptional regulator, regulatory protein PadR [Ruaniaceae bacterium KH17]|nr:PadR family transcriptional regulator, regulatory protein PadR [Ruaniaceae bacterium KH17]